ncbi:hypothetical protein LTR20_001974 [Exophiala xenobiotica]|nr:hypothetical protein LTS13_004383 [Exophiala xenobiotica]KAK5393522.1 hypothetical protein LTR79_009190 [Exophiala xenobiotica]KAK5420561.1 hypothetical protein LTR90_003454 [Exophiala xenobiotica]KAK5469464.1 hypothetical protein LTR20_001974 [Exophiala xenobiotica]KAK5476532.1 hypothetical protein LTR26_008951 [Exophiala xenobiotica]
MHSHIIGALTIILASLSYGADCPCGWRLKEQNALYTHRLLEDFSQYPDVTSILNNPTAIADNPAIRLNAKYDWRNVEIKNKSLVLKQRRYSADDLNAYHADDRSEIDVEIVTAGDSLVNNTINYTLHPSLAPDGSPIPNATLSRPLNQSGYNPETFHEYRFDCDPVRGVDFYVDGKLMHTSDNNIPTAGGNLKVKLWADGNEWWSGTPSTTDVFMTVKSIVAYYNTSTPDLEWEKTCRAAGRPSKRTICTIK